jgi:enoyl-CoA hydratase/carnithine racemase
VRGAGPIRFDLAGDVARITLACPPLKLPTIATMETLNAALAEVAHHPTVKVLVLAAAGRGPSAGVAIGSRCGVPASR